jgi:hypothetical protein
MDSVHGFPHTVETEVAANPLSALGYQHWRWFSCAVRVHRQTFLNCRALVLCRLLVLTHSEGMVESG